MTDAIMIFAAGFGTRMGALTRDKPKPLIPVAGVPLIDRAIALANHADIQRIVVNTHYLATQLHQHLDPDRILISHESPQILDTGGGLQAALPLLDSQAPFTLNPDVIWLGPNPITLLRDQWDPDQMDGLLMCVPIEKTHGRNGGGDFTILPNGDLKRGGNLVYGGAQILKTDHLADFAGPAFSLNQVWDDMNADGRLRAIRYPGEWCDVGRPENIALAEKLLAQHDV